VILGGNSVPAQQLLKLKTRKKERWKEEIYF